MPTRLDVDLFGSVSKQTRFAHPTKLYFFCERKAMNSLRCAKPIKMICNSLLLLLATAAYFPTAALAQSPKIQSCASMATLAQRIVELKSRQSEKQAFEENRKYGLAPLHVDILDGVVIMVYRGEVRMRVEDIASNFYLSCVMRP